MGQDELKADLFRRIGFGGDPDLLDAILIAAGVTTGRKPRILSSKQDQVRDLMNKSFILVCSRGDCRDSATSLAKGRTLAVASLTEHCECCGGSASAAALERMVQACHSAGIGRICVVGGTPKSWQELRDGIGSSMEVRVIEGTVARSRKEADADIRWADAVVLWGPTPLDHRVSDLYRDPKVTVVAHRGIQQFAQAVENFVAKGRTELSDSAS